MRGLLRAVSISRNVADEEIREELNFISDQVGEFYLKSSDILGLRDIEEKDKSNYM